ncbi:MAG: hypothetical protein C0602_00265 [Denitrovibrio sp.]|nr:MAG: hypothetical protein C0602_00265 [Denitrovibrio sp.]
MHKFKCKCGRVFDSPNRTSANCTRCGIKCLARLRTCEKCGTEYYGTGGKYGYCQPCGEAERVRKVKARPNYFVNAQNRGVDVPPELLEGLPKEVQHHVQHTYFVDRDLSLKIAKEAKTD